MKNDNDSTADNYGIIVNSHTEEGRDNRLGSIAAFLKLYETMTGWKAGVSPEEVLRGGKYNPSTVFDALDGYGKFVLGDCNSAHYALPISVCHVKEAVLALTVQRHELRPMLTVSLVQDAHRIIIAGHEPTVRLLIRHTGWEELNRGLVHGNPPKIFEEWRTPEGLELSKDYGHTQTYHEAIMRPDPFATLPWTWAEKSE